MSFGVGIGDILLLTQLAKTTVANCRSAPNDFAEASRVSQSLYLMLDGVRTEFANDGSPLHRDERTRTDFAIHFKNCERSMKPMAAYIAQFASLNGPKAKLMDRFRISKRVLMELRGNVGFYTARMSEFLQVIGLGTVGRVEKKVDDVKDYLPRLMARLDQMCAEVRIMGEKESLLSEHPDDEKLVWKTFRTRLINAGFTSRVLREHEAALFLRIRELTKCALLDSDLSTKASSESSDLSDPETSLPVLAFPWQEPKCHDGHFRGDESYAKSETTITPKPSITSLKSKSSTASLGSQCHRTPGADGQMVRLWRDRVGNPIAKARFLHEEGFFVVLQDIDRQEIKIARTSLSNHDIEFIGSSLKQLNESTERLIGYDSEHEMKPALEPKCADEVLITSKADADTEVDEILRDTRSDILVGKRTYIEPQWRHRVQLTLSDPPNAVRWVGKDTNDTLPKAASCGDIRKVKMLLKLGYNIEATGPESWTETTGSGDDRKTVRHSFPETTALYRAADAGYFDVALYLLEQGADVNTRNGYDGGIGQPLLFKVIRNGDENMTRLTLEYEAKIAKTTLHIACSYPRRSIVRLLLDYKAPIDATNLQGETPLYVAAMQGYAAIVKLLLEEGAAYDTVTHDGQSPLYKAAGRSHLDTVRCLLRYGADSSIGRGRHGETTIYKVAWNNDVDIFELLLKNGADCNLRNESKMASYRGLHEQVLHGIAAGMGKTHALMNHWGRTVLHAASYRGFEDMVAILVEHGAQLDIMGNDGQTAMYLAAHEHHRGVVQILLSSGAQMQTERHDPVLALLNSHKNEANPPPSRSLEKPFNDPQALAKIGTTEVLVGFVAKMTEQFSKRRR